MKYITRLDLRKLILKEQKILDGKKTESEMLEFSKSRSGKKVMAAGNKIISASKVISNIADDQTGRMRETLYNISEFVSKLGSSLSGIGMLNENESAADTLPTVAELKKLQKNIKRLEK